LALLDVVVVDPLLLLMVVLTVPAGAMV